MDRDEVFGLRDYRKVWKQVILVVIYEFKFVTTQLCYVSFGTQKVQSGWGSAPDPDGSACSPMPPFVRLGVVGGGGGGGGVSLAHPHKTLAEKRAYCRNH